jgi:cytidylate kinase
MASDAVAINTSNLSIDEVVKKIIELFNIKKEVA